jgi:uncharacterized protein (DUF1697 family)
MVQVALLRAVNLGPHNKVSMSDLRDLLTRLGFEESRSLLQSGNLVFRAARPAGASLERLLETETEKRLRLRIESFVRSAKEWKGVVAGNPFTEEAARVPGHLLVMFFRDVLRTDAVNALQAAITGRERVRTEGKQAYIIYPDGIGRSRVTNAFIEKQLGSRGTGRNWNTVLKLGALAEE